MNPRVVAIRQHLREMARERWECIKRDHGLAESLDISYGHIGEALRKAAHDLEADIVIIGRGRIKQPLGRLRSDSYAIIRESPCPVISI